MSAERIPRARPRGLVLVRGGLDVRGGDGDDWDDFCRRIGWQTDTPEPDNTFEERIAEGLFAEPLAQDNVIELDLARGEPGPAPDSADATFAQEIRRSFVRRAPAATAAEPPASGPRRRVPEAAQAPREQAPPPVQLVPLATNPAVVSAPEGAALAARERGGFGAEPQVNKAGAARAKRAASAATEVRPDFWRAALEGAAQADFAPDADVDRRRRGWATVGAAALTLAVAAGVLLVIAQLTVFRPRAPAASIVAPPAETMHATAARPRSTDALPVDAPPPPDRAAPPEEPTARPTPGPSTPRSAPRGPGPEKTPPPGAVMARRSTGTGSTGDERTADRAAHGASRHAGSSLLGARDDRQGGGYLAAANRGPAGIEPRAAAAWIHADPTPSWNTSTRPGVALPAMESVASAGDSAGTGVWSSGLPASGDAGAERARVTDASWSLAGTGDRWVGASLTPAPSSFAQANIGVMLQVDLGKALGKL